jgi:hypothetical protein
MMLHGYTRPKISAEFFMGNLDAFSNEGIHIAYTARRWQGCPLMMADVLVGVNDDISR